MLSSPTTGVYSVSGSRSDCKSDTFGFGWFDSIYSHMNMFYFFTQDLKGNRDYGEEYFVMSEDLKTAKTAVENSEAYKERKYSNIDEMGYKILGVNEVIQTELS